MASSDSMLSSSALLECSICMEDFSEGNFPRTLPCTHVYCTECLSTLARDHGGEVRCPECREEHVVDVERLRICRTTMKLREFKHTQQKQREAEHQKQRSDDSDSASKAKGTSPTSAPDLEGLLASLRTSTWEASQSGKIYEEAISETRGRRSTLFQNMETAKQTVKERMDRIARAASDRKQQLLRILEDAFQESLYLLTAMEEELRARQESHERFCREMAEREAALRVDDRADPEEIDRLIQETQDRDSQLHRKILIPAKELSLETAVDGYRSILTDVTSWGGVKTVHVTHEVSPVHPQAQSGLAATSLDPGGANHYVAKTAAVRTISSTLESPSCVAQLPNGDIATGSSMSYRVGVFGSDLANPRVIPLPPGERFNEGITGMCATPNGRLYVSNPDLHTVHVVTPEGHLEKSLETYLPPLEHTFRPWGLASNVDGEVFVCDRANHLVRVFDQSGLECRRFGGRGREPGKLRDPSDVAVTPDGEVLVADLGNDRIQVFDGATGQYQATFGSPGSRPNQLKGPVSIAVDTMGVVAVAEKHNRRVQLFTSHFKSFHILQSQADPFQSLRGITITKRREIVVCDSRGHRVQIF